ncbi:MAG: deoxyribodipyrimidine photo-lyase [Verrucomicrobiia bacterium]
MNRALVWFRRDLRTLDHPALAHAARQADSIVPFFIFDPTILQAPDLGAPRVAYLLAALESLDKNLRVLGGRLIIRQGPPRTVIPALAREAQATAIYWNDDVEPYALQRDADLHTLCQRAGLTVHRFHDQTVHGTGAVLKPDGKPYAIFTPYSRAWLQRPLPQPLPRPSSVTVPPNLPSDPLPTLHQLGFTLRIPMIPAGEKAALDTWKTFASTSIHTYASHRNLPALDGTSHLSPHLRFGTISPRWLTSQVQQLLKNQPDSRKEIEIFRQELIWRDFYKTILAHFPHVATGCFKPEYNAIAWENRDDLFQAWCEGRTGYPIVDAAMRQLNATGWMHNRLRMIVASFLTKDLLISWQWGERYFMQHLFDGDLAANNGGWQWAASTGTDAQPYFRIFNPTSQAEKFDPEGRFINRWVPEANSLSYPPPLVDHSRQRLRALALYQAIRS